MADWEKLADEVRVMRLIETLGKNGITAEFVRTATEAKEKALSIIPEGSEVFTYSSLSLERAGIRKEIDESGKYDSIRKRLSSLDRKMQGREMRKLAAAPDYSLGSVHAVTESGELIIASQSGSQLPGYSFTSGKNIWIVGTQKIVKDLEEGMLRLREYVLPLESERAKKVYGKGSAINKLLIINAESKPGRLHIIFVDEKLGF
ncbi:MAG: lactate utilization protein [Candidatus Micrarchaeota archaeon]